MDRCPCASAVAGAFVLAPAGYVAFEAKAFFGLSAMNIARAAEAGHAFAVIVAGVWAGALLLGLFWSIVGWRATLKHVEPPNGVGACYSAVILAGCWWLLQNVLAHGDALVIEIGRAAVLAFIASNVVNLYLQLRGLFPGKLPLRRPAGLVGRAPDSVPNEMFAHQARALEQVTADRDRLSREVAHLSAQLRGGDLAAFVELLGGRRKVLAWVHPDSKSESEKPAATKRFQSVSAILERIGAR